MTADHGAFLENLVFMTLRRKRHTLGYYESKQGHEIDFVYRENETTVLVQAAWTMGNEATRQREMRALESAAKEFPNCHKVIITFDEEWEDAATRIKTIPLWKFLLQGIPLR